MKTITNKTHRPLSVPLPRGKTLFLGPGKTFCPHAPGAMEPLQSALKFFRGEFERGIVNTDVRALKAS